MMQRRHETKPMLQKPLTEAEPNVARVFSVCFNFSVCLSSSVSVTASQSCCRVWRASLGPAVVLLNEQKHHTNSYICHKNDCFVPLASRSNTECRRNLCREMKTKLTIHHRPHHDAKTRRDKTMLQKQLTCCLS